MFLELEVLSIDFDDNADNKRDAKLKNHFQVYSMNRLSNPDNETVSTITAGGDKETLEKDINDYSEPKK